MSGGRRPSELERQAARHLHTRRGAGHQKPVAATAWHCAGAWQAEHQMDIWQCCDEVALDAMREHDQDDEVNADDQEA